MAGTPFVRPLKTGPPMEEGKDVVAVQRAMVRLGHLKGPVTGGAYAEKTWDAVKSFQLEMIKQGLLEPGSATGNYGSNTHKAVVKKKGFDSYGGWLLTEAVQDQKPDPRDAIVRTGFWYYSQRTKIDYEQYRPITTVWYGIKPPSTPKYLDCSGFFITTYWANGLAAKLGRENAQGFGNTWSLSGYGTPVAIPQLRPGDAVFYGNCSHVALYAGGGSVISMGSYPMKYLPVTYRSVWGCRSYLP